MNAPLSCVSDETYQLHQDIERFKLIIASRCSDIATSLLDSGKVEQEELVRQMDVMAKKWATEISRCEQMHDLAEKFSNREISMDETIKQLQSPDFGVKSSLDAFKNDESYRLFAEKLKGRVDGVGLQDDDDEVVVESQSVAERDPFTCAELTQEPQGFPVVLPCGHTYNHSSVFLKGKNGWELKKCAVAGCSKVIPDARNKFKEDLSVKVLLQRKKQKRPNVQDESLDVDAI